MKKQYTKRSEAADRVKRLYVEMIESSDPNCRSIVEKTILSLQKKDGSFSVIDSLRGDSDCVLAYAFYPTYYATAALIYRSSKDGLSKETTEALIAGLKFAARCNLRGHGFDATAQLLEVINIYKQANLYEWMAQERKEYSFFADIIHKHIRQFREAISTGRTFSDWNVDFA